MIRVREKKKQNYIYMDICDQVKIYIFMFNNKLTNTTINYKDDISLQVKEYFQFTDCEKAKRQAHSLPSSAD